LAIANQQVIFVNLCIGDRCNRQLEIGRPSTLSFFDALLAGASNHYTLGEVKNTDDCLYDVKGYIKTANVESLSIE
jgi:hypothetical protein